MSKLALAAVIAALTFAPCGAAMPLREPEVFPAYASDAGLCGGYRDGRVTPPACAKPTSPA